MNDINEIKRPKIKPWVLTIIATILNLAAAFASFHFIRNGILALAAACVAIIVIVMLFEFLKSRAFPEDCPRQPIKSKVLSAVEIILYIAASFVSFSLLRGAMSIISLVVLLSVIMAVFQQLKNKTCTKTGDENPPKILKNVLYGAAGIFCLVGIAGVMYSLFMGYTGSYALFIGSIIFGIILAAILSLVPIPGDEEHNREVETYRKEIKYYEKDERVLANNHKAAYYTFWVTLSLLLIFGAVIAVFPIYNIAAVAGGILGICTVSFVLFIILAAVYGEDKIKWDKSAKRRLRFSIVTFIISLVPVGLMGARWIHAGLDGIGTGFFLVFAVVSGFGLVDVIMRAKGKW